MAVSRVRSPEPHTNTGTYEMRLQLFFATMGATAGARKPISNSSYSVCTRC